MINLDPNFITGFCDAEGSFVVSIRKKSDYKVGWVVEPIFAIHLHGRDTALLHRIKSYFGVGTIRTNKRNGSCLYSVNSKKDIINVIIHYPLRTQKRADFELLNLVLELMNKKEHQKMEGLRKIMSIKASLNNGLTEVLKKYFPGIVPLDRPNIQVNPNLNFNWLVGFTEGDGSFGVQIRNYTNKVSLRFTLTQHLRDIGLMKSFIEKLKCGTLQIDSGRFVVYFVVTNLTDITDKLIPLFNKYPLQGTKKLDYADFVKIAVLMKNKSHLTAEGLDQIRQIKTGMNRKRDLTELESKKNKEKKQS